MRKANVKYSFFTISYLFLLAIPPDNQGLQYLYQHLSMQYRSQRN
ncbi:hypothetical protein CI610_02297 [invertebrate metagenome]|uniref:Uncharacterized protein n=1 Tax=invertebrate metagenome TaxID=1711999 RepID=A0A2H9T6C8_9ZZZZ